MQIIDSIPKDTKGRVLLYLHIHRLGSCAAGLCLGVGGWQWVWLCLALGALLGSRLPTCQEGRKHCSCHSPHRITLFALPSLPSHSAHKVMNGKTALTALVIQTTADAQLDIAHPQGGARLQGPAPVVLCQALG